MKKTIKKLIPPIILDFWKRIHRERYLYYFGNFDTWEVAERAAKEYGKGYAEADILKKVSNSTELVRAGEAAYEQDGVAFHKKNPIPQVMAGFGYVLAKEERAVVLDFGGALGSTFFRHRDVIPMDKIDWNIVEQPHFVKYGRDHIDEITFYDSLEQCFQEKQVNVVLLSGAIQYFSDPYETMNRLINKKVKYIIIDDTPFFESGRRSLIMLQHVPNSIYSAVYPVHILCYSCWEKYMKKKGYEQVVEWTKKEGIPIEGKVCYWSTDYKGFVYRLSS